MAGVKAFAAMRGNLSSMVEGEPWYLPAVLRLPRVCHGMLVPTLSQISSYSNVLKQWFSILPVL